VQFYASFRRIYRVLKNETAQQVISRQFLTNEGKEAGPTGGEIGMIEVTKLNGVKILVNPDLFEVVEETPDTVITLTTGKKIIVKESRQELKNLVKLYRKDIFAD